MGRARFKRTEIVGWVVPDAPRTGANALGWCVEYNAPYFAESEGMVSLGAVPEGSFGTSADAVSADGSIIAGYNWTASGTEAVKSEDGTMLGLGDLPGGGFHSTAEAMSADGSVIVGRSDTGHSLGYEVFIWDAAHGMRNLRELLMYDHGLDLAGWTLLYAPGISADGTTIVGTGFNPDGTYEAWIATIPEPASLGLIVIGGALTLRRRRKV